MQRIGKYAFYGCTALESVRLSATLKEIEDYAFKGDALLSSVTIPASLDQMGKHVFYGCNQLTFYCEASAAPQSWNALWNSAFRPVIWECVVSDGAVTAFSGNASAIENGVALNGISGPYRAGYLFVGWATAEGGEAVLSAARLYEAADGSRLYAVWELTEENKEV